MKSARTAKSKAVAPQPVPPPAPSRPPLPNWAVYAIGSVAALIPCFWQVRIQAGDLASHIYNAWLAQLIQQGRAPGLKLVTQHTNVLFDFLLSALISTVGPAAAQRIAVSLAVLLFVWGAWAFVVKVSGARPAYLLVAIVMLAYGWVFHMGLFNYYISLGFSFWALSLAWDFRPTRLLAALPLFALAYVAHGLALTWALGVLAYKFIAERVPESKRLTLLFGAIAAIAVLRFAIVSALRTAWFPVQLYAVIGADQLAVYGDRYWLASLLLFLVFAAALLSVARISGARALLASVPAQVCILTAFGIAAIPNWIAIPGYNHALVFLAERTSLALAICLCAIAASAPPTRTLKYGLAAAAVLFFAFLYRDEAALNALESQMVQAVAQLPPNQRVLNGIDAPNLRTNPVTHLLDRACLGRCYSYGNYEPSSAQFRVRIAGPSPLAVPTDQDANTIQTGAYVVQPRDIPLYQVLVQDDGQVVLRSLQPGMQSGMTVWNGL